MNMVERLITRVKAIMGAEIFMMATRVRFLIRKLSGRKSKPKAARCRMR